MIGRPSKSKNFNQIFYVFVLLHNQCFIAPFTLINENHETAQTKTHPKCTHVVRCIDRERTVPREPFARARTAARMTAGARRQTRDTRRPRPSRTPRDRRLASLSRAPTLVIFVARAYA